MSDQQPTPAAGASVEAEPYKPTWLDYVRANFKLVLTGAALLFLGATIGRLLPPFVIDQGFWRDFLTGPPIAGLFAVAAAFVAFSTARSGNKTAQKHAEEEEWWNRAEWSIGLALSAEEDKKLVGLKAISVLLDGAAKREDALIEAVAREIVSSGKPLDTGDDEEDNDQDGGGGFETDPQSEYK